MSRHYDLIIFGATGFTGQYVAEEVSRIAGDEHISWAVAGRNVDKMKTILENVEKATGVYIFHWLSHSCCFMLLFFLQVNLSRLSVSSRLMLEIQTH